MKEKIKKLGVVAALAIVMAMFLMPPAAAAEGDLDTAEGTVLVASFIAYFLIVAGVFWALPQKKEKKAMPLIVGIGIAIALVAILFYFTEWLTGWNITFWDEWIDWAGHTTAVMTAVAGSFLIWLVGGYKIYEEKNPKKERDVIIVTFIAWIAWTVLTLIPALTVSI